MTTGDILYARDTMLEVVAVNDARDAVRVRYVLIGYQDATRAASVPLRDWYRITDLDAVGWRVWHPYRGSTPAAEWEVPPCRDV